MSSPVVFQFTSVDAERVLLSGALIMDLIRKGRNAKLHEGKDASMEEVLRKMSCLSLEYQKRAVSPNPNMKTSGIEV
jgi:hypothetical protein